MPALAWFQAQATGRPASRSIDTRISPAIVAADMCTVVALIRPSHRYPLLLAANRDEHRKRPWDSPGRHWPDQPDIVAGRDRTAGGTWMGVNRAGVVAAILNRAGTLGPAVGKRSRGEIPLLALRHPTRRAGCRAVAQIDAAEWRDFNLVIGDRCGAFFIRGLGRGHPTAERLPDGVAMVTAYDPNDLESPRVARHLPRLRQDLPRRPRRLGRLARDPVRPLRRGRRADQRRAARRLRDRLLQLRRHSRVRARQPGCLPPGRRMRPSSARLTWGSRPDRTPGHQERRSLAPKPAANESVRGCWRGSPRWPRQSRPQPPSCRAARRSSARWSAAARGQTGPTRPGPARDPST